MTEQHYTVVADRDKGDIIGPVGEGDRVTYGRDGWGKVVGVRIERPVPTADEPKKPELVTLHLYRDTCAGGLFLSERELDRTLHEHVEALTIRRDRLPSPHPPTREQIAEAIREVYAARDWMEERHEFAADAVLALIQNGADR